MVEENLKSKKAGNNESNIKSSSLTKVVNKIVAILFVLQLFLCFIAGISYSLWVYRYGSNHWYLLLKSSLNETLFGALTSSFSWMILINTFVPISLLVTLEMTRFMTTIFIEWDLQLFDNVINRTAKCNTSTIHDDLGIVDVIFSDKTGTLTQNKQELRYLSLAIHDHNDQHVIIMKDEYDTIRSSQPTEQLDPSQRKWRSRLTLPPTTESLYVKPLKSTSAFEAFGSLQTEIALKVKDKKSGKSSSVLKKPILTSEGTKITYLDLPAFHPLPYTGLPPRWTSSLIEAGLIQPLRPFQEKKEIIQDLKILKDNQISQSAVQTQWKLSQLMHNSLKHGTPFFQRHLGPHHSSNVKATKSQYSFFSYLWNTAQGHAYYQWFLALSQAQALKKAQIELDKSPSTRKSTTLTRPQNQPAKPPLSRQQNTSPIGLIQRISGTLDNENSGIQYQGSELALLNGHNPNDVLDDMQSVNGGETESDEPILVSTFGVSAALHSMAHTGLLKTLADTSQQLTVSTTSPTATATTQPTLQKPTQPNAHQIYNRLFFEKEYFLPSSFLLGSFRQDSRTAILTALWSKNWAHLPEYADQNIYIAPYQVRKQLFRYVRSMALSSTVKAYRKPDGTIDWQFESAEEYAMVRFAASLGFCPDVHPSGEGVVLYIREFFSPNFEILDHAGRSWSLIQNSLNDEYVNNSDGPTANDDNKRFDFHIKSTTFEKYQSVIHAEVYNSLGVCGFSSARARVSIILQRVPQLTFPLFGAYTPQSNPTLLPWDCLSSLNGFNTIGKYSTYFSEYDRQFRNQADLAPNTTSHPFDVEKYKDEFKNNLSYSNYCDYSFSENIQNEDKLWQQNDKNYIHILTKGQDSTTIPLIQDTILTPQSQSLQQYRHAKLDLIDDGDSISRSSSNLFSSRPHQQDPFYNTIPYTNPHHGLKQQLYEMENSSLRCLVAAYSELPNQWWEQYESLFAFVLELDVDTILPVDNLGDLIQLMNDNPNVNPNELGIHDGLNNTPDGSNLDENNNSPKSPKNTAKNCLKAAEVRHMIFQHVEESASLTLLGCFGMEDQLQSLVPETIRDLSRAAVRVWMITGDKLDVAKNIALACELIDADMLGSSTVPNTTQNLQLSNAIGIHLSQSDWGVVDRHHFDRSFAKSFSNLGRYESNLVNPDAPNLFPLCIRQNPSSRLCSITGEWLLNFKQNRQTLMSNVFTALTEYDESTDVLVELGYLQQCLLHVGLDLSLTQLGSLFILDKADIDNFITNVSATTTITRERFVEAMNTIGDGISDRESISTDIDTGLYTYQSLHNEYHGELSTMPPISLLVNRNAFNIMFQNETEADDAQEEFQRERYEQLLEKFGLPGQNDEHIQSNSSNSPSHPTHPTQGDFAPGFVNPSQPVHSPSPSSKSNSTLKTPKKTSNRDPDDTLPWLAQKFFALSLFAKSVVFARAEPAMKKKMVTSTRKLFPDAITLAIGDGANDTDMITAAHVGIGIAGVEGTAASNSADYAVGTFRMLHRLLLVHGISYARIEKIILLMFYKGSMVALCHFFYGYHSSFSGSQLLIDLLYQLYNSIYTAWSVVFLIQHQPLPNPVLENSPPVYREMKANSFRLSRFAFWLLKALIHAVVIFYVPLLPLLFEGNETLGSLQPSLWNKTTGALEGVRGRTVSLEHISSVQIAALAVLPNIMACFMMESINFSFIVIVILSALSIFLCTWIATLIPWATKTLYTDSAALFGNPQFWLLLVLIVGIPVLLEYTMTYFYQWWSEYPGIVQLLKERIYVKERQLNELNRNFVHNQYHQEQLSAQFSQHSPQYQQSPDNTTIDLPSSPQPSSSSRVPQLYQSAPKTSLASSSSSTNQPQYIVNENKQANIATTFPERVESPLDLQLKGYDPDPNGLFSAETWGDAGGYGVRSSSVDEMISSNTYFNPHDRMNALNTQANALLKRLSHHNPTDLFIPPCFEFEQLSQQSTEQDFVVADTNTNAFFLPHLGSMSAGTNVDYDGLTRAMSLRVFRLLSLLTQSLDTDQQQQQKQSSARGKQAMLKNGVAYPKRDRFLTAINQGEKKDSVTEGVFDDGSQKKTIQLGLNKKKTQFNQPDIIQNDGVGNGLGKFALSDDPILVSQPLFVTSSASSANNNNNNSPGEIQDKPESVTVTTARTFSPDIQTDHYSQSAPELKQKRSKKS
jgi:magnesium-transporting ATPase (P-type)